MRVAEVSGIDARMGRNRGEERRRGGADMRGGEEDEDEDEDEGDGRVYYIYIYSYVSGFNLSFVNSNRSRNRIDNRGIFR